MRYITLIIVVLVTVSSCGRSKKVDSVSISNKVLKSSEVASIAEEITVRIDGANTGSGVIIESLNGSYTVVTNEHVVRPKGRYTIQTFDGRKYKVYSGQVKKMPGVDLASFKFRSNKYYRSAEKGNSDQIVIGKTIYVAGYPDGTLGIQGRNFRFLPGVLSGILKDPIYGYALDYTVETFKGMSGGAILDDKGKLVGIHGRAGTQVDGVGATALGIPLKNYLNFYSTPYKIRAKNSSKSKDYQGAIADYTKAIQINPNDEVSYNNRGYNRDLLKDYKGAISDYTKAIEINPNNAALYSNRGYSRYLLQDYKGAIADYNKAIEINPNYSFTYNVRGVSKYRLKDYQGAISDFIKAIEINPNDAVLYINRGDAHYKLASRKSRPKEQNNHYQGAIADYNKAAALYQRQGRTEKAQESLKNIDRLKSDWKFKRLEFYKSTRVFYY